MIRMKSNWTSKRLVPCVCGGLGKVEGRRKPFDEIRLQKMSGVKYSEIPTICEESVSWCESSRCRCYSVVLLVPEASFLWSLHSGSFLLQHAPKQMDFPYILLFAPQDALCENVFIFSWLRRSWSRSLFSASAVSRRAFWSGWDVNTAGLTQLSGWTWQQSVPYEHRDGRLGDQMSKQ